MSSRRERARSNAFAVSEEVRNVTSPGLGRWRPAWELVAGPSDRFIDTLYEWERSGSRDDLDATQRAAEALVQVWREADAKFRVSLLKDAPAAVGEVA